MEYAKFIDDVCEFNAQDEYSTHHEFSNSTASEESNIQAICHFLSQRGDKCDEGDLQNIVTGEILNNATKQFLLGCLERGDKLFHDYRNNRTVLKNKMLFDCISKEVIKKVISQNQQAKDTKKESMILLKSVDVAHARAYDVKTLLSYEIGSTSFFLTKDGYLRPASNKSDLQKKTRISQVPLKQLKINCRFAVLFDFMAYARKLEVVLLM